MEKFLFLDGGLPQLDMPVWLQGTWTPSFQYFFPLISFAHFFKLTDSLRAGNFHKMAQIM